MSAPAARVKTPEFLEMNRIEGKTDGEVDVNPSAHALSVVLSFTRAVTWVIQTFPSLSR